MLHRMSIGVDATCWKNQRGYGRHVRALFSHLLRLDTYNHYEFIVDFTEDLEKLPENASWRYIPLKTPSVVAAKAHGSRSLNDLWSISQAFSGTGFQLLIFPTVYTYVPVRSRAKKIVFIHDVIPETYPGMTTPGARSSLFWRIKTRLALLQADKLLTVSEYSRAGIANHYRIEPRKIGVVGEAPDGIFKILKDAHLPPILENMGIAPAQRIVAFVGGFGPHKNVDSLLLAFQEVISASGFDDLILVLVGDYQTDPFLSDFPNLDQFVKNHLANKAIFTGYLEDDLLVRLLNCASVLVLPSRLEGFGLPAIEAAASGCPVIATRNSPLPEILGESALYFDPQRVDQLVAHLKVVLSSNEIRQKMRLEGLSAVKKLSWDSAAMQLFEVIQNVTEDETSN